MTGTGLSHSEIHGSMPVCGSPRLIATCYVLHRLLAPRHPPIALSSLITKFTFGRTQKHSAKCNCPKSMCSCQRSKPRRVRPVDAKVFGRLVGLTGLEPVTLRLSSACSNQLSYRPIQADGLSLVELRRFELLTYSLQSYRSTN